MHSSFERSNKDQRRGYALRTLGELVISMDGQPVSQGPARETGLLVYLALGIGRSVRRESLIGLLWDTGTSRERRRGLSQLLYGLRTRYPLIEIAAGRESVTLTDGVSGVDALDLLVALDKGDMEAACSCYAGRFLEGFYIQRAAGFEEWQESMGRDLDAAGSRALRARIRGADGRGQWWLVEQTANRLLRLDPYDEELHAVRIRSIAADGDQTRASRDLDRTVDLLRRDLGQPPGQALRDLAKHLNIGPRTRHIRRHEEPPPTRFVGRIGEFRELRDVWESVLAGRGASVAVVGEAGIGKSRLCLQLLRLAAIEGGRILDGQCFQAAAQVPYSGIASALRGLREVDLSLLPKDSLGAIQSLMPELASTTSAPMQADDDYGNGRRRLFDATTELLRSVSRSAPVALFVDDAQWADASSRDLLSYIARMTHDSRVLVLLAIRPEELVPGALAEFLSEFRNLSVAPLSTADSSELIASLNEAESLDIALNAQHDILRRAAGRPFLIVELIRYLAKAGTRNETVPAAIEALLCRRLHDLTKPAQQTVDVLGVFGAQATMPLLERITRLSTQRLVNAIEELEHRHIIQEVGSAFTFSHELMREAVYRRMSSVRRRWLHKAVGVALQKTPSSPPGSIALHMQAAGEPESAYRYALEAADHSRKVFAHSETEFFLRIAIAVAPDADSRLVALDRLCTHCYALEDLRTVAEVLPELRIWYRDTRNRLGILMVAVSELHSALADGKSSVAELGVRATGLASLVGNTLHAPEAATAVGLIFQAAGCAGQKDFIRAFANAIDKEAMERPPDPNSVRLLAGSAKSFGVYIDATEGYRRALSTLDIARQVADRTCEIPARIACGIAGTVSGEYSRAFEHFDRAIRLLEEHGLQHLMHRMTAARAVLFMEAGRLGDAAALLRDALGLANTHTRLFLFANLGAIAFELRDWAGVGRYARSLRESNQVLGISWARIAAESLAGLAALEQGRRETALTIGKELANRIKTLPIGVSGIMDPSYVNIFLARSGLLGRSAAETANRLKEAADGCRSTYVGAAVRMDIEYARLLVEVAPESAWKVAQQALAWAKRTGASTVVDRAVEVLRAVGGPD